MSILNGLHFANLEGFFFRQSVCVLLVPIRKNTYLANLEESFLSKNRISKILSSRMGLIKKAGSNFSNPERSFFFNPDASLFPQIERVFISRIRKKGLCLTIRRVPIYIFQKEFYFVNLEVPQFSGSFRCSI